MNLPARLLFACLFAVIASAAGAQQATSASLQTPPLTAEQVSIYRSFLASYKNGSKSILNVANETERFNSLAGNRDDCLKDFGPVQSTLVHHFGLEAFAGLPVKLVNPRMHENRDPGDAIRLGESVDNAVAAGFAAGIFTFSELIYNPSHDRVAFNYSFVCGGLCGHGGTVIFARKNNKWVEQKKTSCGRWIS